MSDAATKFTVNLGLFGLLWKTNENMSNLSIEKQPFAITHRYKNWRGDKKNVTDSRHIHI